MAREHARVKLSIWEDEDFRGLSPAAQHLYFVLMTSPEMNYAGVSDWRPNRIAMRAGAWTALAVEVAAQELADQLYIVVDVVSEEVLLRSLIRHDGLLEQPNIAVAVKKAWAAVASPTLRGVIVHELRRLHVDKPELKGWPKITDLLGKPSVDPSDNPSFHPSRDPSDDPSGGGGAKGSDDPSRKGSPITVPSSLLPVPSSQLQQNDVTNQVENRYETLGERDATRPTCTSHPNGDGGVNCGGCMRRRQWDERQAVDDARAEAAARLACRECGGDGWITDADGSPVAKCLKHGRRKSA